MGDAQRSSVCGRDIDQVITALKKGAYLLKYGRRGKPKFSPFQISHDETALIWYSGKKEKKIMLDRVYKIIPGQRTAVFQRYPRPEKEYQSFSLIYGDRSLDLICKDKDEAEVWFVGLESLITRRKCIQKWKNATRSASAKRSPPNPCQRDAAEASISPENMPQSRLGMAISDIIMCTAGARTPLESDSADNLTMRNSTSDSMRISLSSAVSSSSQGSFPDDFDALGDVFIWGEGIGGGVLGGGGRTAQPSSSASDSSLPRPLDSAQFLDVHNIACGVKHAALVNRQGEIFTWGEESGGRLGHGFDADAPHPKLVEALYGLNVEQIACGECHTCAVTCGGDLYTWGSFPGSESANWVPRKAGGGGGGFDNIRVSHVACGPFHTAIVSISGQLFTLGDGTFGVLGHGDRTTTKIPREVDALRGLRTSRVACGVWHTAAVVEMASESSTSGESLVSVSGKLFTWGEGDNGRLGHGDFEARLVPAVVSSLRDKSISQVGCECNLTAVLTTEGEVYTTGNTAYGQLGSIPHRIGGKLGDCFVESLSCGSYHMAVLTSKGEVYTWGKGTKGQLGHGDYKSRSCPSVVCFLKDKQVRSVACGANFTAVICLHKWAPSTDCSSCSGCRNPFTFRRKRHHCYNCGLIFCHACTIRKAPRAALAPKMNKPYRVCDDCYRKLKKVSAPHPSLRSFRANQSSKFEEADNELRCLIREESRRHDNRIFPVLESDLKSAISGISKLATPPKGSDKPTLSRIQSLPPASSSSHDLADEISRLRIQVEELASRSQHLEAELERKTRQLREVTFEAADESGTFKSAKEAIKTLTSQLKEFADVRSSSASADIESTPQGPKTQAEKQHIVQAELGVFLTLSALPGGFNELKRVRFSRKYFSEEEAERWWTANGATMIEQYNVKTTP